MIGTLLAVYAGVTLGAAATQRVSKKWGALAHYHGWEWLVVPIHLAQQVLGTFQRSRP